MEITYMYPNVLVNLPASRTPTAAIRLRSLTPRLPSAVAPLHSQSTDLLVILHKLKRSHEKKSCLIGLTMNTSLFISKNQCFTLFSRIKLFFSFSLLQTIKLYLKWPATLQQPWTIWHAPTMWILVNAKTDLDKILGPKNILTTWT